MNPMVGNLDPEASISTKRPDTGIRVVKNSAALFAAAIFNRGAGLVVAILVARFLDAAALGTFAVVMGLALLIEVIAPLGQDFVIIREMARDRTHLSTYWVNANLVTFLSSIALGFVLVAVVHLLGYDSEVLTSTYVVALYLPLTGLYLIARAFLQGLEKMEYLAISTLIGRVLGLLILWLLLEAGVGVVAAFIGRGLFQLTALLILTWVLIRQKGGRQILRDLRPDLALCKNTIRTSFPFAIQNLLSMALTRVNAIILSLLVILVTVGMFDAADRVRQTSAMIIPIVIVAILPALSRYFITEHGKAIALLETALKLLLILIFPFVFIVVVAADKIIPLLYGQGYEAAIPVLRVVIWAQIFFVVDAVLSQAMMATNNEHSMVRRTALALGVNILLTVLLALHYGAIGAAFAVVLTRALHLALDAQFVNKNITRINLGKTIGRPLLCASLSGALAFALRGAELWVLMVISIGSYMVFLLIFRAVSPTEIVLMRRFSDHFWKRMVALIR